MQQKLNSIRERYNQNIVQLKEYIQYIESLSLSMIGTRTECGEMSQTFETNQTIDNINSNFIQIQSEIHAKLDQLKAETESITVKQDDYLELNALKKTQDGEIISYLENEIYKGILDHDRLFSSAMCTLEFLRITKGESVDGDRFIFLYSQPEYVHHLVDLAVVSMKKRRSIEIQQSIDNVNNALKVLDFLNPNNRLSIYKQCFIQLMAYFDSCVFELIQVHMEFSFFQWLKAFENKTIKSHELAQYDSFDEFKSSFIRKILKECYVKDLLGILKKKNETIFFRNGNDVYAHIMEGIRRRNVHIHHDGKADELYLNEYNLYSASLGDYLPISKSYLDDIFEVTEHVINSITTEIS